MPLLDSPVPPATDAPLEPLALPPLRSLGNLRYKSSSDIQSLLDGCAPCLLGDKEISVLQPPAKLSALYRKLDSLFKSEKGEARREAVRNAIAEFSQTATREDWQRYAHFFDGHYTRNLVGATEEFEMMVICWSNSQKSRIHNHAGGECFVGTLQGPLTERLYDNFMDRERMERNDPKDLQVMEYTGEIKEIGRSVLETGMVGWAGILVWL